MRYKLCILFFTTILLLYNCKKVEKLENKIDDKLKSVFALDHLNIWVTNPEVAKDKLNKIGFTSLPDSLSKPHIGQGTKGNYFYFLNTYLELIFVLDQHELIENNSKNKDLDFTIRANSKQNGASPFSVALKLKEYKTEEIPFDFVEYHQELMSDGNSIYSAKNSKLLPKEPSVFVIYPEIESVNFGSIKDLQKIPEEYSFARDLYKHQNKAKKITNIVITTTGTNLDTKTIKELNKLEIITIKKGKDHLMELYFDNHIQNKIFDLRPELPLKIYL